MIITIKITVEPNQFYETIEYKNEQDIIDYIKQTIVSNIEYDGFNVSVDFS